jgi:ribonuclease HI
MGAWFREHEYLLHAWSEKELKEATREQTISMPYLELLSILHSVNVWQKELANNAIDLQSDCDPVVQAINKGYSREPSLHHLLRLLFFITSLNKIYISCSHIAGVDNKEADALSRAANQNPQVQANLLTAHFLSLSSVQESIKVQDLVQRMIQPLPLENWNVLKVN